MSEEEKLVIDGFEFQSRSEYLKALKEQESVVYMKERSNWERPQVALKLYNKLLDNDTFHTVIGYEFLKKLRQIIIINGILEENYVRNIKLPGRDFSSNSFRDSEEAHKYKELYEDAIIGRKIYKIIITFLVLIIVGMGVIAYMTNSDERMEQYKEQVINQYEDWKVQLEEKEKELIKREESIVERENILK